MGEVTPQFLAILRFFFESQDDWYSGSQVMKITNFHLGRSILCCFGCMKAGGLTFGSNTLIRKKRGDHRGGFTGCQKQVIEK